MLNCWPHHRAPSVALLHGCPGSADDPANSTAIFRCSLSFCAFYVLVSFILSFTHALPYVFCSFNRKVLCCYSQDVWMCLLRESPRLTHFMSFRIPSPLVPENLFLYESPFTAALCVWITCLTLRLHCRCLLLLIRPSGAALCHLEWEMKAVGCGSVWGIIRTEHSHGWMGCRREFSR